MKVLLNSLHLNDHTFEFFSLYILATPVGPASQDDYDFELVYRSKSVANYVEYTLSTYFSELTVCAWIYAPDMNEDQEMAVWSIIGQKPSSNPVLRARIDGRGGFFFSWNHQR